MPFDATIIHWPSIAEFAAALKTIKRPVWCRRLCNHNTYKPDERNWAGMKSMISMRDFYRDTQKWPSGPHLFLAATAPNPADTGIFQLTPITRPGTHAGPCNADALGLESVGDFDRAPPSAAQYTLLITINLLIMQVWGLPPDAVTVHRDCMPGRTCPGKYLTSEQIRASLNTKPPKQPATTRYRAITCAPVFQDRRPDVPLALTFDAGAVELMDDLTNGWLHLSSGAGFSPLSCWVLV